jgi:hypothetical protein
MDVIGHALLDDATEVHDRDPVGDVMHDRQVMRDEDDADAELSLKVFEQVDHLRLHGHVESGHRFIADQHLRPHGQCAGDADPLPLATGELVRVAVVVVGVEPHEGQQLPNPRAALAPRSKALVDLERLADDLLDRHPRVE